MRTIYPVRFARVRARSSAAIAALCLAVDRGEHATHGGAHRGRAVDQTGQPGRSGTPAGSVGSGHRPVPGNWGEVKDNETSHLTELLEPGDLDGAVVTFDALHVPERRRDHATRAEVLHLHGFD